MKIKSLLPIIILSIIDIALLVVILTSLPKKDGKDLAKADKDSVKVEAEARPEKKEDTSAREENAKSNEDAQENQPKESQEDIKDSKAEENQEGNKLDTEGIEGIVDIEEGEFDVSDYSTTERPSLSDFMWYFDGVHYTGIPENVEYIMESDKIVGDWKGFIFYDPDRKMNSYGMEFLNVNIDINGQKSNVTFDCYQYYPENSEAIDVSGQELKYSGDFEYGSVYATGGGNVHIDTFYTNEGGKQYGVGYIDTPDGTPAYLALVRP